MVAAANIGGHEVEAVRRQRARNQVDIAVVAHAAAGNSIENIATELLEPLVVNDPGTGRTRGRDWVAVQGDEYFYGRRVRRVFHRAGDLRVVEEPRHERRCNQQRGKLRIGRLDVGVEHLDRGARSRHERSAVLAGRRIDRALRL